MMKTGADHGQNRQSAFTVFIERYFAALLLAAAALPLAIPAVVHAIFCQPVSPVGLTLVYCTILFTVILLVLPGRYTRYALLPVLPVCLYYATLFGVTNGAWLFWGLLCFLLLDNVVRHKKKPVLLMMTLCLTLFAIDTSSIFFENTFPVYYENVTDNRMFDDHDTFGWHQLPGIRSGFTRKWKNTLVCTDVEYVTDNESRRVCKSDVPDAFYHGIFLGCSFMWGECLNADDILPCKIQQASNGILRTYNLSVPGSGTAHAYIKTAKPEYHEGITERTGVCVYGYITDHIYRNTGHPWRTTRDATHYPLFRLNEKGILDGPFKYFQDDYLHRIFMRRHMLHRSFPALRVLNRFTMRNILPVDYMVEVTAQLINYAKYAYQTRYTGEFFVVMWPEPVAGSYEQERRMLMQRLEDMNIRVIDVPDMSVPSEYHVHLFDNHPGIAGNEWVFQHVWPEIQEYLKLLLLYHPPHSDTPSEAVLPVFQD